MSIEKQQKRMQHAVTNMIDELYKTHLRKMQGQMHSCAARCCDDGHGTVESVQKCIDRCAHPLLRVQDYLQRELRQFEGQLQNCIMRCSEGISEDMPNQKVADLSKFQQHFDKCTVQCVDQFIKLIPNLMKSIQNIMEKNS